MILVKIRFNNECKDGKNFWRVIIDGKEEIASGVKINCECWTTCDDVKGVPKHHITCYPGRVERTEVSGSFIYTLS